MSHLSLLPTYHPALDENNTYVGLLIAPMHYLIVTCTSLSIPLHPSYEGTQKEALQLRIPASILNYTPTSRTAAP